MHCASLLVFRPGLSFEQNQVEGFCAPDGALNETREFIRLALCCVPQVATLCAALIKPFRTAAQVSAHHPDANAVDVKAGARRLDAAAKP